MSLDGYETGGFHDPALRGRIWRLWSRALREVKGEHADRSEWALLHALMRRAHLFIAPTEMADAQDEREYSRDFIENFVLPFPVVAATLEDDASVNLLAKMPDDWLELKDGKVGYLTASISEARAMASVGNSSPGLTGNWLIFCMTPARPMNESEPTATIIICGLVVVSGEGLDTMRRSTTISAVWGFERGHAPRLVWNGGDGLRLDELSKKALGIWEEYRDRCGSIVTTMFNFSMHFMLRVQQPRQFIVRIEPEQKPRKPKTRRGGRRRHLKPLSEMPVYLSLEPREIRKQFGDLRESGDRRPRRAHERRAHFRRLSSPRFRYKRGQVVPVRASWVGPVTGTTPEGREYRVLIDKAIPLVVGEGGDDER